MEALRLRFFPWKQFFSLISSDSSIPERLNPFTLPSFPYLLEKRGRWLLPSSPRRARLLPPEATAHFWKIQEGPSGPDYYLHLFFTKYTHFWVFLSISFRYVVKLYGLRNDTCFPSLTSWNSTDYATMLVFYFRNVTKLYGWRNNACFDFRNVAKLYGLCNNACCVIRRVSWC